jgi:hypothetical protein
MTMRAFHFDNDRSPCLLLPEAVCLPVPCILGNNSNAGALRRICVDMLLLTLCGQSKLLPPKTDQC